MLSFLFFIKGFSMDLVSDHHLHFSVSMGVYKEVAMGCQILPSDYCRILLKQTMVSRAASMALRRKKIPGLKRPYASTLYS
ncbi:hypothetical protein LXL04_004205 [Taraxacum kok-saghyz]